LIASASTAGGVLSDVVMKELVEVLGSRCGYYRDKEEKKVKTHVHEYVEGLGSLSYCCETCGHTISAKDFMKLNLIPKGGKNNGNSDGQTAA